MTLLDVQGVNVVYEPNRGTRIWSVREVDLALKEGEFVGLVGESGCGKSTLGFALTRMLRAPARLENGVIQFAGVDVASLSGEVLRRQRRNGFAIVLQSGMNALNPVRNVEDHFADILKAHARSGERHPRAAVRRRGAELLGKVRLDPDVLAKFPFELSGGMRQRVSIALVLALDVIVQKAVMNTIQELQQESGFTAILISHDLGVVLESTNRVMVMYAGRIVEDQPSKDLVRGLHHPYTEALLRCYADPRAEEIHLAGIPGSPPDLSLPVSGCAFASRCPLVQDICWKVVPPLAPLGGGLAACHVRAPSDKVPGAMAAAAKVAAGKVAQT